VLGVVLVGVGGFAGAIARYVVDGWVSEATGGTFPFGTLAVNLTGAFVLGVLFSMASERAVLSPELRGPLMIGFIGAYTTFSTLMLETWRLAEDGAAAMALLNIGGSCLLGLAAVWLGLSVGRAI
jgi:CrcB protein